MLQGRGRQVYNAGVIYFQAMKKHRISKGIRVSRQDHTW